jgi:probable rRNA maturation factor
MSPDDSPLLIRPLSRRIPRTALREFLTEIARRVTRGRRFGCLITNDRELRSLNRKFRSKNYATDVLSFPNADVAGDLGEIAISIDRAAAQAAEHGHSITDELRILMLHGALHLAGFDHETDSGEMARAEIRWRRQLGLPSGLIERASVKPAVVKPTRKRARS